MKLRLRAELPSFVSVKSGVSKLWIWRVEGYTLLSVNGIAAAHYWLSSNQKYPSKFRRRTGDLCGFRMYVWALPSTLLCWWMYSTYIHQSVSLLLAIREFLKSTWTWSATVLFISACELQAEQLLVIEFKGWVVVKRSFRSQEMVSHLRITASFDVYDSGNVTKRPCWRCWRLAVWGCMYAPVLVPSKSLYWGICRRYLVSFPIANFYKSVARDLWSIPVHGWSDIFRGLTTLFMILCTFSQTLSPIAMIEIVHGPRAWGGISWMGAVTRWYGSCWDMTTCDDRISQYLVDWIMCCLVIDIPILIILDPKPSFETLDLWALDLRSSTIGYAKKANRS